MLHRMIRSTKQMRPAGGKAGKGHGEGKETILSILVQQISLFAELPHWTRVASD